MKKNTNCLTCGHSAGDHLKDRTQRWLYGITSAIGLIWVGHAISLTNPPEKTIPFCLVLLFCWVVVNWVVYWASTFGFGEKK